MFRPPVDSLIFDLDGTLWDASQSTAAGWSRVANSMGIKADITPGAIKSVSGLPFDQCVETLFPQQSRSFANLKSDLDHAEKEEVLRSGGALYPGVAEWIPKLSQHFRLFLVSNCQEWYLEAFLEHSKLAKYFSDTLCFGQTGLHKTKNIQEIVRRNSLKKPLYVGDTGWDQHAAFYAGVKFIFASYGFGSINTYRCPTTNSFSQLAEWMLKPQNELPHIELKKLGSHDFEKAQKFYQSVDYVQPLDPESIYYGAFHDREIVGLVRLTHENNIKVLRGMQIRATHQFLGIGTRLIKMLETDLGKEDCFCLPYGWLENFYGQIGFKTISAEQSVPQFLVERFIEYQKKYPDFILMRREGER